MIEMRCFVVSTVSPSLTAYTYTYALQSESQFESHDTSIAVNDGLWSLGCLRHVADARPKCQVARLVQQHANKSDASPRKHPPVGK